MSKKIFLAETKYYDTLIPNSFNKYKKEWDELKFNSYNDFNYKVINGKWNYLFKHSPIIKYDVNKVPKKLRNISVKRKNKRGDIIEEINIHDIAYSDTFMNQNRIVSVNANSKCITNKSNLLHTMIDYFLSVNRQDVFDYIPLTFVLDESPNFFKEYVKTSNHIKDKNLWIYKPSALFAGQGIKIINIDSYNIENFKELPNSGIIQEYISTPVLYSSPSSNIMRKFDVRFMVLLVNYDLSTPFTKTNSSPQLYIYKKGGFVRTTHTEYSVSSNDMDPAIHITNHSIQKSIEGFGKYEEGNLVSFEELKLSFQKQKLDFETVYLQWIELTKTVFKAGLHNSKNSIVSGNNENLNVFELFGLDILVYFDENKIKSKILEVNDNPMLKWDVKWADTLSKKIVSDMVNLTIGKKDYNNGWELIG